MADRRARGGGRAKVPSPQLFEEQGATIQYLKKWSNVVSNYHKQNDEFLVFFEGEEHENWTAKSADQTRGLVVMPRAGVPANVADGIAAVQEITQDQADALSRGLRRDLDTLLNSIANYAPEAFYDTIINDATSIRWIFDRLSIACKLNSGNQYILNSHLINYNPEHGDTPEKLYLRIRSHYGQAAPQAGTTFDNRVLDQNVQINELCELMFVEQTLSKIDPRLPAYVQATRAHLMHDGKTLFCIRRLLWDQIDMMLTEMNEKEDLSATVRFARGNFQSGRGNFQNFRQNNKKQSKFGRSSKKEENNTNLCGACFRANKSEQIYTSHDIANCKFLSKEEKSKLIRAAARLLNADNDTDDADDATDLTGDVSSSSNSE